MSHFFCAGGGRAPVVLGPGGLIVVLAVGVVALVEVALVELLGETAATDAEELARGAVTMGSATVTATGRVASLRD